MKEREPRGERREEGPNDLDFFRSEMRGVVPAQPHNRAVHSRPAPKPVPTQRLEDERAVLTELSRLAFDLDDIEFEDDAVFLRPPAVNDPDSLVEITGYFKDSRSTILDWADCRTAVSRL